jgi:hypothetical protein
MAAHVISQKSPAHVPNRIHRALSRSRFAFSDQLICASHHRHRHRGTAGKPINQVRVARGQSLNQDQDQELSPIHNRIRALEATRRGMDTAWLRHAISTFPLFAWTSPCDAMVPPCAAPMIMKNPGSTETIDCS